MQNHWLNVYEGVCVCVCARACVYVWKILFLSVSSYIMSVNTLALHELILVEIPLKTF